MNPLEWRIGGVITARRRKRKEREACTANRETNLKLLRSIFSHAVEDSIVVVGQNGDYCDKHADHLAELTKNVMKEMYQEGNAVKISYTSDNMVAFVAGKVNAEDVLEELSVFYPIDRFWIFEQ